MPCLTLIRAIFGVSVVSLCGGMQTPPRWLRQYGLRQAIPLLMRPIGARWLLLISRVRSRARRMILHLLLIRGHLWLTAPR